MVRFLLYWPWGRVVPNARSGFNIYFQKQQSSNGSQILSLVPALFREHFCVSIVWSSDLTRVLILFQILVLVYFSDSSKLTSEFCLGIWRIFDIQCDGSMMEVMLIFPTLFDILLKHCTRFNTSVNKFERVTINTFDQDLTFRMLLYIHFQK